MGGGAARRGDQQEMEYGERVGGGGARRRAGGQARGGRERVCRDCSSTLFTRLPSPPAAYAELEAGGAIPSAPPAPKPPEPEPLPPGDEPRAPAAAAGGGAGDKKKPQVVQVVALDPEEIERWAGGWAGGAVPGGWFRCGWGREAGCM